MYDSNRGVGVLTQAWAVSGTPWNWMTAILPPLAWETARLKSSSVQPGRASPAEGMSSGWSSPGS